jgi:hypothetical protein
MLHAPRHTPSLALLALVVLAPSAAAQQPYRGRQRNRNRPRGSHGDAIVIEPVRESGGYSIAGRKVWRDSGWFVGGAYDSADSKLGGSFVSRTQSELEGYGIVAGKYLAAATALELSVHTADITTDFALTSICSRERGGVELQKGSAARGCTAAAAAFRLYRR